MRPTAGTHNQLRYYLSFSVGAGLVLIADAMTPLGVSVWAGYVLLLQTTQSAPHRRFPFVAAAVFTGLSVAGLYLSPLGGISFTGGLFNRVMASAVLWASAFIIVTRRQAVELLTAVNERFRLMVDGVKDYAIFMLDTAGNIQTWNSGAERVFGYKADEVIGQSYSRFFRSEDVASGAPREELDKAAADGVFDATGWRVRKDGSQFWGNGVLTALYDENGEVRGFAKVTRDLTEQHEYVASQCGE